MHFSFAATYLYRSLGIPARVGIGYSVPAANRAGGSALLIQAVHGHAWPEIYFKDIGWVIVDPAPQQTLVDMSTDPRMNCSSSWETCSGTTPHTQSLWSLNKQS